MRRVGERIASLRGWQEDYRDMERRVLDDQLRLEVQKMRLVGSYGEQVDALVREGVVERGSEDV